MFWIKLAVIIVIVVSLYALFRFSKWFYHKFVAVKHPKEGNSCVAIQNSEKKGWNPTYKLERKALQVSDIPFTPERNEIFYLENEYDEEANLFVQENIDLIKEILSTKGLTFVYLPSISLTNEQAETMVAYYSANFDTQTLCYEEYKHGLRSSLLLDYMVRPENRPAITASFAWCNSDIEEMHSDKIWNLFNFITFDGAEARKHPREVLEDMLPELGIKNNSIGGYVYDGIEIKSQGLADDKFNEETKKILAEVQEKLDYLRLKGISEAIIAQHTNPNLNLSRITISNSFTITLNDYDNLEIMMAPLVKAVFILFLRHEEGIRFKNLPDYRTELEIIYRAIKAKKNDIDSKLKAGFTPQICDSVKDLTNPCSNSINEKCTRIKEAFIVNFHDRIASNYYIQGMRAMKKSISISRELVIWED